MRIRYMGTLLLLLAPWAPAWSQQQPDSASTLRTDSLRHRIEERFAARVQERLGLTNEQTVKLKATSQTFGTRRRELRDREQRIRDALWNQLQPGVAANRDSVTRLTDGLIDLKQQSAQAARDEMKELATYLNPVQRARLFLMREHLHHRVKEAHGHRGMGRRHRDRSWM
jgi:LTXXQ motif family protein